ncbi:MAG: M48 family metallopeptidase [Gammaproteobacteria bacterium]|nr:M48 family metallopeptidase [Gammaproteobacteria bacterium]
MLKHKTLIKTPSIIVVMLLLSACATSPTGRSQFVMMPKSQMVVMGVQSFQQLQDETPLVKERAMTTYVQCVAQAIIDLPSVQKASPDWEVQVFDDDAVNAFALPGGKIGVNKGLLKVARSADQLAAVLGHEVGHVLARHGNERVSQQFAVGQAMTLIESWMAANNTAYRQTAMAALGVGAKVGVLLPFGRTQESESDEIGQDLMARAGFDPRASVTLWQNMAQLNSKQPAEFLSTHPSHKNRIKDLQSNMSRALALYDKAQAAGRTPSCRTPGTAK